MGRHTRGEKAAAYHHRGLPNNIVCQLLELLRPSAERDLSRRRYPRQVRPSPALSFPFREFPSCVEWPMARPRGKTEKPKCRSLAAKKGRTRTELG